MAEHDTDEYLRRQLRTLQRVVGNPTDAALARRSGVAAATFSEVMSGKRSPRREFVTKVISGCLVSARTGGHAPLDEQRVLQALRLPGYTASESGVLERDEDLRRCSAVLDAVRAQAGAVILLEGTAGIGKSELVARIFAEAAVRGVVPLAVRGNQRDQTIPFGAVRTLLTRWVANRGPREQQALFTGAAGFARTPLGLSHPDPARPGTMIGFTEALYWLVVNATALVGVGRREEGLLLAVDDAHWLDEESLAWLEFLSGRLAGLPLVVVVSYRPHQRQTAPTLTRIALHATVVIQPQPLSLAAVRILITHRLAPDQPPDERFTAACLRHSGGNPFYLHWMLDLIRERALPPTASAATDVDTLTPQRVVAYLNERLASLGPAASRLAHVIAVLGPGCSLDDAARLAGLTPDEATRHYDQLCHAAIVTPGSTVDFCHPIIRGAVYDNIGPARRSDLHAAAAHLLDAQHASSDLVAAHLLHVRAAADRWVVDTLCRAAADAMAAGLATIAARYLHRAIQEPPLAAEQCRVRLRYGQALALGQVADALPELLTAYQQAPDQALRAEAAIALAKTSGYADQPGHGVRLLDTTIHQCDDDRLSRRLLAEQLLWAAWWADDPHRADRMRLLDRLAPSLTGDTHVSRLLISLHAWSLVLRGQPRTSALAAIQPILRRGVVFTDVDDGQEMGTMVAFVHLYSDEPDLARDLFDQAVVEFDRDGWRGTHLAFARAHLANTALRQGRLADAVADARIAHRLADRAGKGTPAEWFATGTLIEALLARGELDRAAAVCADRTYRAHQPDALILPVPQAVLGALLLAQQNTAHAIIVLRGIGRWADQAPLPNPAVCPWRFDLAHALRQLTTRGSTRHRRGSRPAGRRVRRCDHARTRPPNPCPLPVSISRRATGRIRPRPAGRAEPLRTRHHTGRTRHRPRQHRSSRGRTPDPHRGPDDRRRMRRRHTAHHPHPPARPQHNHTCSSSPDQRPVTYPTSPRAVGRGRTFRSRHRARDGPGPGRRPRAHPRDRRQARHHLPGRTPARSHPPTLTAPASRVDCVRCGVCGPPEWRPR
jgi:hypothetical protein